MAFFRPRLRIRGRNFLRLKNCTLERSCLSFSGGFQFTVPHLDPWPFPTGEPVQLFLGNVILMRGYVFALSGGGPGADIRVECRDKTADLVDCSPDPDGPNQWTDQRVLAITTALADPFGIDVHAQGDLGPTFPTHVVEPGEMAKSAIERMLRMRGLLAYSTGDGALLLAPPASGKPLVVLEEGKNILDETVSISVAERYRTYVVRGQRPGNDADFGDIVATVEGRSDDPEIGRPRPLVIVAENAAAQEDVDRRAGWEATVRAAKSSRVELDVRGWAREVINGQPFRCWGPNEIYHVHLPKWRVNSPMLCERIRLTMTEKDGQIGRLVMVRQDAFSPEPEVSKSRNPFAEYLGSSGAPPPVPPDESEEEE